MSYITLTQVAGSCTDTTQSSMFKYLFVLKILINTVFISERNQEFYKHYLNVI